MAESWVKVLQSAIRSLK